MPNPSELQRQHETLQRADRSSKRKCYVDFDSYTADEIEFMFAMQKFKDNNRKPYPDCRDILGVLRALGYRKVAESSGRVTR